MDNGLSFTNTPYTPDEEVYAEYIYNIELDNGFFRGKNHRY